MSAAQQVPSAVIHVDLDGARHVYAAHDKRWNAARDPLFETGMANALAFFETLGVKATLFVVAEDIEDDVRCSWLRRAVSHGHEIASHTITHAPLTQLDPERREREIRGSRERLERTLDVPVTGFRAPGFFLDRDVLERVRAAGYAYDSSLFAERRIARTLGLATIEPAPHTLPPIDLVELPLPAYRPLPFPWHPCYSLILGTWYFRTGLRRHARGATPLVMLMHLTDFADPLPETLLQGMKTRLYTLSHLATATKRKRLDAMFAEVRRRFRITSTQDLLARHTGGTR